MNLRLKNSFEIFKKYKYHIDNIFSYIKNKNELLTIIYNDYLKDIKEVDNYKFSLDTFNFQIKLINIEYDNYYKLFNFFLNRMYGDYYKLYNKLLDFVKKEVKSINVTNDINFPKYKDLEINNNYDINLIEEIYSNILSILLELSNYCLKENNLIKEITKKQNNGLNISTFVNEKKYSIIIIEQKINFYNEIILGYILLENKFVKCLFSKLELIYSQISNDINLETSISKKNININEFNLSNESNESNQSNESNENNQSNESKEDKNKILERELLKINEYKVELFRKRDYEIKECSIEIKEFP